MSYRLVLDRRYTLLALMLMPLLHSVDDAVAMPFPNGDRMSDDAREKLGEIIQDQIDECWIVPKGLDDTIDYKVTLQLTLSNSGQIIAPPKVLNATPGRDSARIIKSIIQAVKECSPIDIPPQYVRYYSNWKIIAITFAIEAESHPVLQARLI